MYHGWKNWETWNVYSWISNREADYRGISTQARELLERYEDEDCSTGVLAESLETTVGETENPLADDASLYHDLLGAALHEVDWQEIASHFVGEAILELHPDEEWELDPCDTCTKPECDGCLPELGLEGEDHDS